jgi:uncharacterized SAM-binding protein YcdF (DUF218 family)
MIYLHKILPYALYPITFIILLLTWAAFSKKRLPAILALFLLVVTSSPIVSTRLVQYLESDELRKSPTDMRTADAIVVLSGMIWPIQGSQGLVYEWGDPDRFFGGIELIKAGMAKKIIFTGGKLPWQSEKTKPEGEILSKYASDFFGIPTSQILITKNVENTKDEANAVKEILIDSQTQKIILVTSAFHMPRSKKLFENVGIEVQTYPVDYKVGVSELTPMSFLPSADAFSSFQFAWRELIGRLYYSYK